MAKKDWTSRTSGVIQRRQKRQKKEIHITTANEKFTDITQNRARQRLNEEGVHIPSWWYSSTYGKSMRTPTHGKSSRTKRYS